MSTPIHQNKNYNVALCATYCDECGQKTRCVEFWVTKDGQQATLHLCAVHIKEIYRKILEAYKK
jgi:hypothetical protein